MALSWGDYKSDGWPDPYISNRSAPGNLWVNNHDGTFTNIFLAKWTNPSSPDKHTAAWDFNNDGYQDLMQLSDADSEAGPSPEVLLVSNGDTLTNEAGAGEQCVKSQEQQAEITKLQSEVDDLKTVIAKLEQDVQDLQLIDRGE